jgi:hypothetical protein
MTSRFLMNQGARAVLLCAFAAFSIVARVGLPQAQGDNGCNCGNTQFPTEACYASPCPAQGGLSFCCCLCSIGGVCDTNICDNVNTECCAGNGSKDNGCDAGIECKPKGGGSCWPSSFYDCLG